MLSERQKTEYLLQLSDEVAQIKDLDLLLNSVLTMARRFVNADAGSIYIKSGSELEFAHTQNETLRKRLQPGKKLIYSTFTVPINKMTIAGCVAHTEKSLNIPDVYKLSDDLTYKWGRRFDEVSNYRTKSMLTVPLMTRLGDVIGVLQIINRQNDEDEIVPFSPEDEHFVQYFANMTAAALERAQMTRNIILRMIRMAELRDPKETGAHVHRVGAYAIEIYEAWAIRHGVCECEIIKAQDILRMAAMLHDVGKVGIADVILKKPARLTDEEYQAMKQHTIAGARLFIGGTSDLDLVSAEVALNHHERWDGNGYPGHIDIVTGHPIKGFETGNGKARGKREEEIPLFGRIVTLCDVYDALCSRRSYKEPWKEEDVIEEIRRHAGKMFDPEITKIFFDIQDLIQAIKQRYPDEQDA